MTEQTRMSDEALDAIRQRVEAATPKQSWDVADAANLLAEVEPHGDLLAANFCDRAFYCSNFIMNRDDAPLFVTRDQKLQTINTGRQLVKHFDHPLPHVGDVAAVIGADAIYIVVWVAKAVIH